MQSVVRYAVCVVFSLSRRDTTRTVMLMESKGRDRKPFFVKIWVEVAYLHTLSILTNPSE